MGAEFGRDGGENTHLGASHRISSHLGASHRISSPSFLTSLSHLSSLQMYVGTEPHAEFGHEGDAKQRFYDLEECGLLELH